MAQSFVICCQSTAGGREGDTKWLPRRRMKFSKATAAFAALGAATVVNGGGEFQDMIVSEQPLVCQFE